MIWPVRAATTKIGTYWKPRWEETLAKKISGIGRWIHRNQLSENFLVRVLRWPNNKLITTVREKRPAITAIFDVTSTFNKIAQISGISQGSGWDNSDFRLFSMLLRFGRQGLFALDKLPMVIASENNLPLIKLKIEGFFCPGMPIFASFGHKAKITDFEILRYA